MEDRIDDLEKQIKKLKKKVKQLEARLVVVHTAPYLPVQPPWWAIYPQYPAWFMSPNIPVGTGGSHTGLMKTGGSDLAQIQLTSGQNTALGS